MKKHLSTKSSLMRMLEATVPRKIYSNKKTVTKKKKVNKKKRGSKKMGSHDYKVTDISINSANSSLWNDKKTLYANVSTRNQSGQQKGNSWYAECGFADCNQGIDSFFAVCRKYIEWFKVYRIRMAYMGNILNERDAINIFGKAIFNFVSVSAGFATEIAEFCDSHGISKDHFAEGINQFIANSYRFHQLENGGDFLLSSGIDVKVKKEKPKTLTDFPTVAEYVTYKIEHTKNKDQLKWLKTYQRCILPEVVRAAVDEAITMVLKRNVFDDWGFFETFEKGLTNAILLYGPPGTGKTMIAESMAAVLDKNLMKITNGEIQSQMPGQSERNIKAVFAKAKSENAVLMFDECDSMLYNRDMVGAVMSSWINCMLGEIENHDGVVLFTTNKLKNLDPALQRRIIAKVHVLPPTRDARKEIWKNLVPDKMPLAECVCFESLSEHKLTGGEIKNAILLAARRTVAQRRDKVAMDDFVQAVEGIKAGKKEFANAAIRQVAMPISAAKTAVQDSTTIQGSGHYETNSI